MVRCSVCSTTNPDDSKFCNGCGSRLASATSTSITEERKVITALFCDLVGFTATSEGADPEDVDRMLRRYFVAARAQIELHGGVVEKFIGDAVVGVFGVPAAHGDDPERAVRAALRIVDEARDLEALGGSPLRLRIGINTGQALVRLDVGPGVGERFLAGDSVNTASRIQSVAPEMGVAVGQETWEATRHRVDYEELPPAVLKGKAEPVRIFHAKAPRASLGVDLTRGASGPFVGRASELQTLIDLFETSVATNSLRFASIVGEPGLGKSRLVAELLAFVDSRPLLVTWRQGRCLPYGSGISFWALGEIVKGHAGVLESDPASVAIEKLDEVLPEGEERAWFRERLLPLLGIESGSRAEREEQFTAWRRFLELVAAQRPTVLVFEDLHWADDAMLDFLEQLVSNGAAGPMFILATTRPELLDRRPTFPGQGSGAAQLVLKPLSTDAAALLLTSLLETAAIAPALLDPILERAAGNPLFAEEFVRLLRDQDLLVASDGAIELRPNAQLPVPESIQALLAARIDALPASWKSMLSDAAVIGKVFWAGAIEVMGNRPTREVAEALGGLAKRELVRHQPRSSMAGEDEYAFWHVLARDVAYAGLPRAARARRHVAAAQWIESKAPDRLEDVADFLAHHYATALDLNRAVGAPEQANELEGPAFRFLSLAGERAMDLDGVAALGSLERALALAPADHPERPAAVYRYGIALDHQGRHAESAKAFEEASALFRQRGDVVQTAMAKNKLAGSLVALADPRGWTIPIEIVALLEPLGPSPELADALGRVAANEVVRGNVRDSINEFERVLEMAAACKFPSEAEALGFRGTAIGFRGVARARLGDRAGLDDLREAIRLASAAGQGSRVALLYNNLAIEVLTYEGPDAARSVLQEGEAIAKARGLIGAVDYLAQFRLHTEFDTGDHDAMLEEALDVARRLDAGGNIRDLIELRCYEVMVWTIRGDAPQVASCLDWLERPEHELTDPELAILSGAARAAAHLLLGHSSSATALLSDISLLEAAHDVDTFVASIPMIARTALGAGALELGGRLVDGYRPVSPFGQHMVVAASAALMEARGDLAGAAASYADAATRLEAFGNVPELAFALLGEGRTLMALDRPDRAQPVLKRSQDIFQRLHAAPSLAVIEALLVQV
jgi:class 3 adenylate cyclase/tetratricopeptide (TPR) repeat protein